MPDWSSRLVWLRLISDSLITLACLSIFVTLVHIARRRRDLPLDWMLVCFGAFLIACGVSHAMEVWTLWNPTSWISGAVEAITAVVAVASAILLVRLVPAVVAFPGPRALRESECRVTKLLAAAKDAIVVADREGVIRLWNDAAHRIFGHPAEDMVGRPIASLMPERFRHAHSTALRRVAGGGPTRVMGTTLELSGLRKDGSEFPMELSLSMDQGEPAAMFTGVIRDTTQHKRDEARLIEANRLENEFLANLSHELRTPLSAIIGFSTLMHDGSDGSVSAEHKEYLGDILSSASQLLSLIDDVLDLSRIETGKIELRPVPVDVGDVVDQVCGSVRAIAVQKRIRVGSEISPRLTGVVADPTRLGQVLSNLVSNALEFTPEGGRIEIRARLEGVDRFRLEVEDTAGGIAPEDLDRLFLEFPQLDATTSRKHQGTGLGLALTKRIVQAQNGEIGASSVLGKGSVFFAVLPRDGGVPEPRVVVPS